MSGEWETLALGELGRVVTGKTPLTAVEENFGGQIPFVTPSDMDGRKTISTTARYLTETGAASVKGSKIPAGSVMVSCIGSDMGKAVITGCDCVTNQQINSIVVDDRFSSEFVYYNLSTRKDEIRHQAAGGSAQPILNKGDFSRLEITLPPLPEQKAIAHILGTLDDKIELNRRMNATLEAMARALFQSWFVDFDPVRAKLDGRKPAGLDAATAALFPAHFDHKAEGIVPTGWRATTLGEVIEISDSKRIPLSGRERETRRGKYPYHGAASVMDYVDDYLFDGIYALMGEDGSVINEDGTPVLQYVWGKFWVNNHAHVLRGKSGISTEHLLLHLKGSNIAPFVNGAVQPKLNQGNMNRIPFMLPPPEIGKAFAKAIEPLFAQIRANTEQSRTLATLRDALLPKLLSGELNIPEMLSKA